MELLAFGREFLRGCLSFFQSSSKLLLWSLLSCIINHLEEVSCGCGKTGHKMNLMMGENQNNFELGMGSGEIANTAKDKGSVLAYLHCFSFLTTSFQRTLYFQFYLCI